ncbi:hypothetical protein OFAG_02179 [Oxalobacter formigenes HOxBLS]|uniref:Uncharacterized protein n=1 Tax=Oxalobacter paraformigenes TaxID=556268 RepID=T5LUU0_9BURK|nr:hypothetical protein OFAG_02179 [Oxalobacter paraformigenes]
MHGKETGPGKRTHGPSAGQGLPAGKRHAKGGVCGKVSVGRCPLFAALLSGCSCRLPAQDGLGEREGRPLIQPVSLRRLGCAGFAGGGYGQHPKNAFKRREGLPVPVR